MRKVTMPQSSRRAASHYHLIDHRMGHPQGFRDDVFRSRRAALRAARERAEWLATVGGFEVEVLEGLGRYLVSSGQVHDPGRLMEVEVCDDPECLAPHYDVKL
jgi:hypothetical protein